MKKLLCLILALITVLSLCACGAETPNNKSEDPTKDNTGGKNPPALTAIEDVTFTIGGKTFHMGMKLSEFVASGVFAEIKYSDETLEEVETGAATVTLVSGGKAKVTLRVWNLSREEINIEDATIVGIWYYPEEWTEEEKAKIGAVSFAGIQLNSTIDQITGVFGKPNVHEDTWENETARSGGWRGFDIEDKFRLYIEAKEPKDQKITNFSLEFKPFTDSIQ